MSATLLIVGAVFALAGWSLLTSAVTGEVRARIRARRLAAAMRRAVTYRVARTNLTDHLRRSTVERKAA